MAVIILSNTDLYKFICVFAYFFKNPSFSPSRVPSFLFILPQACNFIKKETLAQAYVLQNTSSDCFCLFWIHVIFVDFLYNFCLSII